MNLIHLWAALLYTCWQTWRVHLGSLSPIITSCKRPSSSDSAPCPGNTPRPLETLILNEQTEELGVWVWKPGPNEQAVVTTKCHNHSCCLTIFRKWTQRFLILRDDSSSSTVWFAVLTLENELAKMPQAYPAHGLQRCPGQGDRRIRRLTVGPERPVHQRGTGLYIHFRHQGVLFNVKDVKVPRFVIKGSGTLASSPDHTQVESDVP